MQLIPLLYYMVAFYSCEVPFLKLAPIGGSLENNLLFFFVETYSQSIFLKDFHCYSFLRIVKAFPENYSNSNKTCVELNLYKKQTLMGPFHLATKNSRQYFR